jgi:hypothetical protein
VWNEVGLIHRSLRVSVITCERNSVVCVYLNRGS